MALQKILPKAYFKKGEEKNYCPGGAIHHHSVSPDTGRNSGWRQIKKNFVLQNWFQGLHAEVKWKDKRRKKRKVNKNIKIYKFINIMTIFLENWFQGFLTEAKGKDKK